MDKIDPKLTAAKVYPIDRLPEHYDEEEDYPDPQMQPMDFFDKMMAGVCAAGALILIIVCLV